jgi:hypothetical protein
MRFLLQVGAAGLRAAQAELRLLLRHREAGVGGVQVGEGENQSCQGKKSPHHFPLVSPSSFPQEITDGIRHKSHRDQVGKGLSKDDKAQKLALQHWLEAVSIIRYISLSVRVHVKHVLSHLKR